MDDHASKLKGLIWIAAAIAFAACCAVGIRPLAHAVPWSWEKRLGTLVESDESERSCPVSPQAKLLLDRLVKRLYPIAPDDQKFSIDVRIVSDSSVNAFATLGGVIFVNSGLLKQAKAPEELAGVLAHEMGHVHHRDIMQGFLAGLFTSQGINLVFGSSSAAASWASNFMSMEFTRSQEEQADRDGLERLQLAHIDNHGFKNFFQRMEQQEGSPPVFLNDHPSNQSRMEMIDTFPNTDIQPIMSADEWNVLAKACDHK